ncbi:LysR family transcriptional regulator [Xylophilus rhododendri]|uniref:LysR family transcriptional regulator n=1 Tax=Xylophilus rhododendri TaxID=2697032 RepID=A0A857JBU0_9BURK|nr:LysR substrate-binding domain-containing protein [Xylophilus rhododendri]QHJ00219.1 LysR family transcriptional regulator [Xylophilus rhododendri]
MELRHLRYFIAVAGALSFTRAAEKVHVTQSTLSHQIRQLEAELGQALFDRIGKRVVLTEAGDAFLAYAQRALQEIDQGMAELKSAARSMTGVLRIGTTHTFNLALLPDCVAVFLQRNPTVKVIVEELPADAIARGLEAGQLDFGIAYKPDAPGGLRFEPLFNEELVLVVAAGHALARRKRIRMIELHQQDLVLLPATFSTRRLLDDCFASAQCEPRVIAEMNTVAAMLSMVRKLPVGTIVAAHALPALAELRIVHLESPTPVRTPGVLFQEGVVPGRAARAFIGLLRREALAAGEPVPLRKAGPAPSGPARPAPRR